MVDSRIVQPEVMKAIREQLMRLKTLIGHEKEGEERSIINRLKEAMENTERAESLYIFLAAKSSKQLEAAEKTIAILKRAITNSSIGVGTSKPKVLEPNE
jgi:hypothetical protein